MAQQSPFEDQPISGAQDAMAGYATPGTNLTGARYTGDAAPQFIGGSIDPASGNLIAGSPQDVARGRMPTANPAKPAPPPDTPWTRLSKMFAGVPGLGSLGSIGSLGSLGAPRSGGSSSQPQTSFVSTLLGGRR